MNSSIERDLHLRDHASERFGVVHRSELGQLGFTSSSIARAVEHGHLTRVHPSVYAVGHTALSLEGRHRAAVLRAGPGAAITGRTAGVAWRMSRFRSPHIQVVTPQFVRPTPGIDLRHSSTLSSRHVIDRDGVMTATRARTIVDLGIDLTAPQLANVLHEGAFRVPALGDHVRTLLAELDRFPGRSTVMRGLALHSGGCAGTRSYLEDRLLQLIELARLRFPEINVNLGRGSIAFEVDFLWRVQRLVVEVDGPGHRRRRAGRTDAYREERMAGAGYRVLRFTGADVRARPCETIDRIRRALDGRRS
ncbi:MAG: DUF559 domain-containing protein [Thermoleophilia bacterium]|nr:DUF559 domain-containing protein [Thermoleophilia bacterium]